MNDWQLLRYEFESELEKFKVGTRVYTRNANLGAGTIIAIDKGDGLLAPKYSVLWDQTGDVGKVASSYFSI